MTQIITGSYVFGDQPPLHLMGWLGIEQERRALKRLQDEALVVNYRDVKHLMRVAPPGLCRSAELPRLCSGKLPHYLERRRGGLPSFQVARFKLRRSDLLAERSCHDIIES